MTGSQWWSVVVFLAALGLAGRMLWQAAKHSLGMR
jgi:hypothetical protein